MVNAVYDHIVAMVIVGILFIGTVVAMPILNFSNLQTVDEQQLRNTALTVFDSMLLSGGSPSDWGSIPPERWNQNNVQLFGLGSQNTLSKYVLDPDKVQRLTPLNPVRIEYERIRELLGLQEYGFRLSIFRPFRVESHLNVTRDRIAFSVTTTRTEDGTPIPNAKIDITTIVTASSSNINPKTGESDLLYKTIDAGTYYTGVTGNCQGNLEGNLAGYAINYAIAVIHITVGGLTTVVVAQNENAITQYIGINTFGNTIGLTFWNISDSDRADLNSANRRVIGIAGYDFDTYYSIYQNGSTRNPVNGITNGEGYQTWSMTYEGLQALSPEILLLVLEVTVSHAHDGLPARRYVLVAGPLSMGGSEEIFGFGPDPGAEKVIAIMTRLVAISDMTYVAKIAFWRD